MKNRINVAFALLCLSLASSSAYSALLFKGDNETGDISQYTWPNTCCSYSANPETSPVRAGKYSMRFELRKGDPIVAGSYRSELVIPPRQGTASAPGGGVGDTRWWGFSVYLPHDFISDSLSNPEQIMQVHTFEDSCEASRTPPFGILIHGDNYILATRWDSAQCSPPGNNAPSKNFPMGAIERGKWTDFVVNVKWSYGSDGYTKVWKNGTLVVNHTGPNFYNDKLGGYFKIGVYKWGFQSQPTHVQSRVLYHDEFRAGDANSNYLEVAPGGGTSQSPSPSPTSSSVPSPSPTMTEKVIDTFTGVGAPERSGCGYNESSTIYVLGCNGFVGTTVNIPTSGDYRITVRAAGRLANANTVQMETRVDGAAVKTQTVSSTMKDYSVIVRLSAGSRKIAAAFINDGTGRDLAVERVTVTAVPLTASPSPQPSPSVTPSPSPTVTPNPSSVPTQEKVIDSFTGVGATERSGCGFNESSTVYVLGCNGHVGTTVNIPASGLYRITVRAAGRLADANNVMLETRVDGKAVASGKVSGVSGGYSVMGEYSVTLNLAAGSRKIAAAFTNDGTGRDLAVERVTIIQLIQ